MADDQIPEHIRTFKFRLLPNKRQHAALRQILEDQRQLYNGALESRIDYFRKFKAGLSFYSQQKELTTLRKDNRFSGVSAHLQRATLLRIDLAFKSFFRRYKAR